MIDFCESSMFICGTYTKSSTGQIILTVKFDLLEIEFRKCKIENILQRIDKYHEQCIKTALLTKQNTLLPNINNSYILSDIKNAIVTLYTMENKPPILSIQIISIFMMFKGKYYFNHQIINPNVNLKYQLFESL